VEGLLFCLLDVTPRVRARQNLVESERKYRELVENANSIIIRITPEHVITFFNEYAQRFFGYAEDEVLGRNVVGTIVPAVDTEGRDLRAKLREITANPERHASNENENVCKDGRRVWIHWANRAVRDGQGHMVELLCVGTDITQRRELEAEARRYQQRLRELTERLVADEEEERWRISRYIHDTIVQNLSLSNIRLGAMEKALNEAQRDAETDRVRQVRALLDQASDECRAVMADLTPALLYELGLVPALNDLADQLQAKHGTRMVVEDGGQAAPVPRALRGLLFESVRELTMNALKHAGPCEIRVAVTSQAGALTIRVIDDGKGFDPAAGTWRDHPGGFGLFSIRQRLEGLGGRLDIASAPGAGTTATIQVPLESEGS
jgi:PAS domain S-box-containing protein